MALLERISADMVVAMRAKDQLKLSTLRSIKTALDKFQKDQQKTLDESGEQSILQTLAKQRREAADAFRGDPDGLWRDVMRRQPGMLAWHVNRPVDPDLN